MGMPTRLSDPIRTRSKRTRLHLTTPGLTTHQAPFVDEARRCGELYSQQYIPQPYEFYSEENHEAWRRLYARMRPSVGTIRE